MTIRIGINGFGRIGRTYLRAALAGGADVEIVAVNDLTDADTLATLLEWDSVAGHLDGVAVNGKDLEVAGRTIRVFSEPDPAKIPWGEVGADVVIGTARSQGRLPADLEPDHLARTMVAVVQGGYVLAVAEQDRAPYDAACQGALELLRVAAGAAGAAPGRDGSASS